MLSQPTVNPQIQYLTNLGRGEENTEPDQVQMGAEGRSTDSRPSTHCWEQGRQQQRRSKTTSTWDPQHQKSKRQSEQHRERSRRHGCGLLYSLGFLFSAINPERPQVCEGARCGPGVSDEHVSPHTQTSEAEEQISVTPDPGTRVTPCEVCNNTGACPRRPRGCHGCSRREAFQEQVCLANLG